jgi:hypothetical protein
MIKSFMNRLATDMRAQLVGSVDRRNINAHHLPDYWVSASIAVHVLSGVLERYVGDNVNAVKRNDHPKRWSLDPMFVTLEVCLTTHDSII